MNSLIATKIKTNMRLVSTKLSILSALTYVPLFRLIPRIQQKLCWFSAIKMFECQKNTFVIRNTQCSIELSVHTQPNVFNRTYTIKSRMNSSNNYSFFILICFALSQSNNISLTNVLQTEGSRSRLLENSTATTLLFSHKHTYFSLTLF